MEDIEKEYYIQWIIADYTPFEYDGHNYFISTPSRENRFLAERFFMSVYNEGLNNGLMDKSDIKKLLYEHNIWNQENEDTLQKMISDIEDIKVWIFENYTNSSKRRQFKKALKDTEEYIGKLLIEKQTFDMYDAKYVASVAKQHYIMGSSIFKGKNKPLFKNWWSSREDDIVQYCYKIMSEYSLNDSEYRELSRSNIWRNIWNSRRISGNLFGKSAVDLSISQRQLVMWSNIYDSVYKSSECPPDSIIEDDDAIDGWMIKQRRERNKDSNKSLIENALQNEKIRDSQHVYIMCDPEDASKVYDCNDIEGKIRFKRIMSQIAKEGCVSYMGLKDTQMEIYRRANEMKG